VCKKEGRSTSYVREGRWAMARVMVMMITISSYTHSVLKAYFYLFKGLLTLLPFFSLLLPIFSLVGLSMPKVYQTEFVSDYTVQSESNCNNPDVLPEITGDRIGVQRLGSLIT